MSTPSTHPDFEDFLRLLEERRVDYMIVGGYAVAFHGFPRFTKDIDVFFADDRENLARLHAALVAFGFQESTYQSRCCNVPTRCSRLASSP